MNSVWHGKKLVRLLLINIKKLFQLRYTIYLLPLVVFLASIPLWLTVVNNSAARASLTQLVWGVNNKLPDSATIFGLNTFLLLSALVMYALVDFRQHRQPLNVSFPDMSYSLMHHLKSVVLPRMRYNFKSGSLSLVYGVVVFAFFAGVATMVLSSRAVLAAYAPDEFVTTWKTDNPGGLPSEIIIPTNNNYMYDYSVDWGDGTIDTNQTGDTVHTYDSPGLYTVKITGRFPHMPIGNRAEIREKILSVEQWGSIEWQSMQAMFEGANNLTINAADVPQMTLVTDMSSMFSNASSFNSNIDSWDVSHVTNMNNMFSNATSFNQPLNSWDTSQVTNMMQLFWNAAAFNQPLNSWDTGSVTTMHNTFAAAAAFNQPLDNWDTSKVTIFNGMFSMTRAFNQPIGSWDTSSATSMWGMFADARAFNQSLDGWDVSHVTSMDSMFAGADAFDQSLSSWNISSITSLSGMFNSVDIQNPFGALPPPYPSTLYASGLSSTNYDATIIGWSELSLQQNVTFDAGTSQHCNIADQLQFIRSNFNWTINDSGEGCALEPQMPKFATESLPDITIGGISESYQHQIVTEGLEGYCDEVQYSIVDSNLPDGFEYQGWCPYDGRIFGSGFDLAAGVYVFTLRIVVPSHDIQVDKKYSLTVHPAPQPATFESYVDPVVSITSTNTTSEGLLVAGSGPSGKRIVIKLGENAVGSVIADSQGRWSYVLENLSSGSHKISAQWQYEDTVAALPYFIPAEDNIFFSTLRLVDTSDGSVVKDLVMPQGYLGASVMVNRSGTKIYILSMNMNASANQGTESVSLIEYDISSGRIEKLADFAARASIGRMALSLQHNKVFISTSYGLYIYDADADSVNLISVSPAEGMTTYVYNHFYKDLAVSADGKRVFLPSADYSINYQEPRHLLHVFDVTSLTHEVKDIGGFTRTSDAESYTSTFVNNQSIYLVYGTGLVKVISADSFEELGQFNFGLTQTSEGGSSYREIIMGAAYNSHRNSLFGSVYISDYRPDLGETIYTYGLKELSLDTGAVNSIAAEMMSNHISLSSDGLSVYLYSLPEFAGGPNADMAMTRFDISSGEFNNIGTSLGGGGVSPYGKSSSFASRVIRFEDTTQFTMSGTDNERESESGVETAAGSTAIIQHGSIKAPVSIRSFTGEQPTNLIPEALRDSLQKVLPDYSNVASGLEKPILKSAGGVIASIARIFNVTPVKVVRVFPWIIIFLLIVLLAIALLQLFERLFFVAKMKKLVKRQELLNHEKRSLLSLASHYLRTPLTILTSGLELLPKESAARKNMSEAVDELKKHIEEAVGKISGDATLSSLGAPQKQRYRRASFLRPRILVPAALSLLAIVVINLAAIYSAKISPGAIHIIAQIISVFAVVAALYIVYDIRDQQHQTSDYQHQLLDYEESLDALRNGFVREVAERLTPAVISVDAAVPPGQPHESVKFFKEGLRQLESTLEQFLLISQLEHKRLKQRAHRIHIKSIIENTKQSSGYPDAIVEARIDNAAVIEQPEFLIRRLFDSIFSNAVEHSPQYQPVEVTSKSANDTVDITFTDHGKGIASDKLKMLFKPLSRVEVAEDFTHQGIGLSLYVNRLIAHYLGGEIYAKSKLGKGTTMRIVLPQQMDY